VCSDWRTWTKPGKRAAAASKSSAPSTTSLKSGATAGAAAASATLASHASEIDRAECPVDVEQLGRATWTFLHTAAAYYPVKPSPSQRSNMLALLNSLPVTYPCSHCASHLGENMKAHPPEVSGRDALSRWLCERHNDVNERLGKPLFNCDKTDERWRTGPADGRCD